jgi:hypothetical protein
VIGTSRLGLTRHLGLALGPLLVLTAACTATVSGGDDEPKGPGPTGGQTDGTPASTPQTSAPGKVAMPGAPLYSRFVRLTNSQWESSVREVLKLSGPTGQSEQFLHAVAGTTDFDNNERVVVVNNDNWSDFQLAAEAVAAKVTATDQALQAVVATTDVAQFIKTLGRRAFRRELSAAEVSTYTTLHQQGATFSGSQSAFTKGAALVITAMLQSPNFLYRVELGDEGKPLSGYEMAAKLSLWIRNSTPSDALLDVAAKGGLDSADGAVAQARTMLDDSTAVESIRRMHTQLYKVELLDTITKDQVQGYSDDLKAEFTSAANSFFDFIYAQNLGLKDLLTTQVGFAGPLMAQLYGMKVNGSGVQQVSLTNRAGWYAQAPFLTQWAINNDPDPIHRGVRINLDTLCLELGPPATVLPSVPALKPNQSNRQRYEGLTNGCGAPCHTVYINPLGFAFEDFDGLGRYRTMDNGQAVDTTGSYPFAGGDQSFGDSSDLMKIIASSPQAHQCWSKKLASYALERDIVESERPLIEALGNVSAASDGSLKQVMLALVQNDAFRTRVGGGK